MKKKLYIIGNGFDVAHKLPTEYTDFRNYLKKGGDIEQKIIQVIDKHESKESSGEKKWSKVEESLEKVRQMDFDYLFENGKLYEIIGIDEDGNEIEEDVGKNPEKMKILQHCYDIVKSIKIKAKEWIKEVEINPEEIKSKKDLEIDIQKVKESFKEENYFILDFNYTKTLEDLYEVKKECICYIHGNVDTEEIEFGHREDYLNDLKQRQYTIRNIMVFMGDIEYEDGTIEKPNVKIINELKKNVTRNIENNSEFFESIKDVSEIYVYGFSFGRVDMPYIKKIRECVGEDATWYIYDYKGKEEKEITPDLQTVLNNLHINKYEFWAEWEK